MQDVSNRRDFLDRVERKYMETLCIYCAIFFFYKPKLVKKNKIYDFLKTI